MLNTAENLRKYIEINKYFDSIQRPLKKIPNGLLRLNVKVKGDCLLFQYPSNQIMEKDIYFISYGRNWIRE